MANEARLAGGGCESYRELLQEKSSIHADQGHQLSTPSRLNVAEGRGEQPHVLSWKPDLASVDIMGHCLEPRRFRGGLLKECVEGLCSQGRYVWICQSL